MLPAGFFAKMVLIALGIAGLLAHACRLVNTGLKESGLDFGGDTETYLDVAETSSATANSKKTGNGTPVPGSVPGTGVAAVAAPAAGANAKSELLVNNNGTTQLVGLNPGGSVTGTVTVPSGFNNISASADGTMVAGTAGTNFSAVNPSNGAVVATANLANGTSASHDRPRAVTPAPTPAGTAIMPDNSGAYVTDKSAGAYYFVAFPGGAVTVYPNPVTPAGSGKPAILPNGSQLWIPNPGANSITVYDIFTNTPVTTIAGISSPTEVAFTNDGSRAAVVSRPASGVGSIVAVDAVQYSAIGSVQVGLNPAGISRQPYSATFWVANSGSGSVSAVDISGSKPVLVETDFVGTSPAGVAVLSTFAP